jgi:hypothetical protein
LSQRIVPEIVPEEEWAVLKTPVCFPAPEFPGGSPSSIGSPLLAGLRRLPGVDRPASAIDRPLSAGDRPASARGRPGPAINGPAPAKDRPASKHGRPASVRVAPLPAAD